MLAISHDLTVTSSKIRGCTIAHEWVGDTAHDDGVDVVWGHGLTQSRALENDAGMLDWTDVDARVLRYDARGHGESDSTPDLDGYSWFELAHDQLELATSLGIGDYIAGGASMGCATALHAAVLAPERVMGLILVIPPTGWEQRAAQTDVYEQGAKVVDAHGVEPVIKAGAAVAPPDPLLDDPDYRERRAVGLRSWDPTRLAHAMRGAARAQLPDREDIAAITCPTLILAWTGDPVHPVSTAEELGRLLPHAEVHIDSNAADLAVWSRRVASFVADSHAGRVDGDADA